MGRIETYRGITIYQKPEKTSKLRLIYFTDPICSTCWISDPYIHRLLWEYQSLIEIEYKMGGLLREWKEFPQISDLPNSKYLKNLWDTQSKIFGVTMDGNIWMNKPINSSYPACIAYHAAIRQDKDKANKYLRTLREMVFLHNADLSLERYLITAAIQNELDIPQFLKDFKEGNAYNDFQNDLVAKKKWEVKRFPTLVFINEDGEYIKHEGAKDETDLSGLYNEWKNIVKKLAPKYKDRRTDSLSVLSLLQKYTGLTFSELKVLSTLSDNEIKEDLEFAYEEGLIIKEVHNEVEFWKYNHTPFRWAKNKFQIKTASIVGGGVCGYFIASALMKCGLKPKVYERSTPNSRKGLGFLMLKNGIDAMECLGLKHELFKKGNPLNYFKALKPNGKLIFQRALEYSLAIRRADFASILQDQIGMENIEFEKEFSAMKMDEHGKIQSIQFADGSSDTSDIYLGMDGIRSKIRNQLFPNRKLTEVHEREIVCSTKVSGLNIKQDEFIKIVDVEQGLYMGLVPLGNDHYIWYLQFNQNLHPMNDRDPEVMKAFTLKLIKEYPTECIQLVERSDFSNAFLWVSNRMDILPAFHHDNMVLAGDAAHPLLALTSQGANSALEDAAILTSLLSTQRKSSSLESLFEEYYETRKSAIRHHIQEGDNLATEFLELTQEKKFNIPLSIK